MFISPIGGPTEVKKPEELTEVTSTDEIVETTKIPPASQKEARRYQYLFQSSPLQSNKSLLRNVLNMVNKFLQQVMGRDFMDKQAQSAEQQSPKQVRGIADRMPRLIDPRNPEPSRDSIFLGEARDYPAAVIAIQYKNTTKPVFYEGNQIVARHLNLECDEPSLPGTLIFNDGTRMPVEIMIITAV